MSWGASCRGRKRHRSHSSCPRSPVLLHTCLVPKEKGMLDSQAVGERSSLRNYYNHGCLGVVTTEYYTNTSIFFLIHYAKLPMKQGNTCTQIVERNRGCRVDSFPIQDDDGDMEELSHLAYIQRYRDRAKPPTIAAAKSRKRQTSKQKLGA